MGKTAESTYRLNPDGSLTPNPAPPPGMSDALRPLDTLERGRQLRTQIGQAIDNELGKESPNAQLVANLKQLDRALLTDMNSGPGSAQLTAARAFS
jgi:hypothetical protein